MLYQCSWALRPSKGASVRDAWHLLPSGSLLKEKGWWQMQGAEQGPQGGALVFGDCFATPSRSCPLFMVTSGLQNVTWKCPKSGHSLYRKRVDWYCRPNGMVYKNEGFMSHFGPVSRRSHGDSRNHISKTEHVFGRIRWLLCVPFREFKKCHKKLIETHRHEEKT